jgi:hypothetical protein
MLGRVVLHGPDYRARATVARQLAATRRTEPSDGSFSAAGTLSRLTARFNASHQLAAAVLNFTPRGDY